MHTGVVERRFETALFAGTEIGLIDMPTYVKRLLYGPGGSSEEIIVKD